MRASTVDELARDPAGRYVAGETYAHFCAHPLLWGVLLWGRPSASDAMLLGRSLVLELAPPARPHASLVDASRLDGGDDGAFRALEGYVTGYAEPLRQWVTKLALVRPKGVRGAIVAGVYEVLPRPYPVAVFDDVRPAIEWLDLRALGAAASGLAETLSTLYAEASSTPPLLSALRAHLGAHLRGTAVAEAARALGVSERTLQRKLSGAGTTFQRELVDARLRDAKRRLAESDAALTTIALDAGFASPQHFNAAFRRRVGMSPSAWRDGQRVQSARAKG